jgi:hypothetical protein
MDAMDRLDWLADFTEDGDLRAQINDRLNVTFADCEDGAPDPDEVIDNALRTVAVDLAELAGDSDACGKVDTCTAQAIVLRHLRARLLGEVA